ncbi:MAG: hypothetical protein ACLQJR_20725 [Stellaceae bacterium]
MTEWPTGLGDAARATSPLPLLLAGIALLAVTLHRIHLGAEHYVARAERLLHPDLACS